MTCRVVLKMCIVIKDSFMVDMPKLKTKERRMFYNAIDLLIEIDQIVI